MQKNFEDLCLGFWWWTNVIDWHKYIKRKTVNKCTWYSRNDHSTDVLIVDLATYNPVPTLALNDLVTPSISPVSTPRNHLFSTLKCHIPDLRKIPTTTGAIYLSATAPRRLIPHARSLIPATSCSPHSLGSYMHRQFDWTTHVTHGNLDYRC